MKKIYKDILAPGVYAPPDGRVIKVTPEDVKNVCEGFKKQLAEGHEVGLLYNDHPEDEMSGPATTLANKQELRDYAYFAGGIADEAFISKSGKLVVGFSVEDDKQAERLLKTKVRVSPAYGPLDLSKAGGSQFPMALHHVAITRRPVQKVQESFADKPLVSLSEAISEVVCLSEYDYYPDSEENLETPVVELADNMDKTSTTPKKKKTSKPSSGDPKSQEKSKSDSSNSFTSEKPEEGNSDNEFDNSTEDEDEALLDPKAQESNLSLQEEERILIGWGINLATDSVLKSKPEILRSVLAAINEAFADQSYQIPVKSVIPMSEAATPAATPETNPEVVKLSEQVDVLKETCKKLVGVVEETRKHGYKARIDECVKTGRCDADKGAKLHALVDAYKFSWEQGGSELDFRLSEIESLRPESVVKLSNESNRYESASVTSPANSTQTPFSGAVTNVGQDKIDEVLKELGYGPVNNQVGF